MWYFSGLLSGLIGLLLVGCGSREVMVDDEFPEIPAQIVKELEAMRAPKDTVWTDFQYPTDQQELLDTNTPGIYQPTAAGTLVSALYGSVRTVKRGKHYYASFHEGIDIAALERDRKGHPLDEIRAVAAGHVAYVNKIAGNSSYGRYVVVLHEDDLGSIYTLYAHLARVDVDVNSSVVAGTVLGVMGNSATYRIPWSRAHLHFEIGLVLNRHFDQWFQQKKLKPSHGMFNGWNLLGVNPYAFIQMWAENPYLRFDDVLKQTVPEAFRLVISTEKQPDYFEMYGGLWEGSTYIGGPIVIAFSENGVPLAGWNAEPQERALLQGRTVQVLDVDENVLGRNGRRLVVKRKGVWELGRKGKELIEIMFY